MWPDRAVAFGPLALEAGRDLKRLERRLGAVAQAWSATCPSAMLCRTTIDGVSRGVLTIRADDSATRFEVDRWLRGGGEREFVSCCPISVRKVRLVVGDGAKGSGRRAGNPARARPPAGR